MKSSKQRWFVVAIFFGFMLLHQSDRLLIGSMTEKIRLDFGIDDFQMGAVSTGALIVASIFYPIWGYLYDRYARAKLLALASFIWGSTTWLNAVVRSYGAFLVTRSSTGIDDSSYPGLYSLISDLFEPRMRGKIYGLLQLTQPLGFMVGMVAGLLLSGAIGWRGVFYITGSLGVLLAILIFFGVKEPPRGQSEPEMAGIETSGKYRFDWRIAKDLFKKRSLRLMFLQGFFGVFPWNAITFWFFAYLERERGFDENTRLITMGIAVLVLALGYPLGGALGDALFKRTPRGRLIVATIGVVMGALLLFITLNIPDENVLLFMIMLPLAAIFIPLPSPNVVSTVYDVTLPEVRSTAMAIQYFIESAGAALSPLIVGGISEYIKAQTAGADSLKIAFLVICTSAWLLCAFFFVFAAHLIPHDIETLRRQMRARAEQERMETKA
jgi:MFS family permease